MCESYPQSVDNSVDNSANNVEKSNINVYKLKNWSLWY